VNARATEWHECRSYSTPSSNILVVCCRLFSYSTSNVYHIAQMHTVEEDHPTRSVFSLVRRATRQMGFKLELESNEAGVLRNFSFLIVLKRSLIVRILLGSMRQII
jgi:hypothetical protein